MKKEEILAYEKKKYFSTNKQYLKEMLFNSDTYIIWKYQKTLRNEEHYAFKSKSNIFYLLLLLFYRRKKNKIGRKLGFDIPCGVFDPGLRIWHASSVIVNPFARVGRDCCIVGNVCIGNVKGQRKAPHLGNNIMLGWGCAVIGDIEISDNCSVGAHALVLKPVKEKNAIMVGVPAVNIRS